MSFLKKLLGLEKPKQDPAAGVLLTTVHGNEELAAIEALLRAAELPYRTMEQGAGDVMRVIAGYNMYGTGIYVRAEDLETAKELIAPVDTGVESEESAEDQGEANE